MGPSNLNKRTFKTHFSIHLKLLSVLKRLALNLDVLHVPQPSLQSTYENPFEKTQTYHTKLLNFPRKWIKLKHLTHEQYSIPNNKHLSSVHWYHIITTLDHFFWKHFLLFTSMCREINRDIVSKCKVPLGVNRSPFTRGVQTRRGQIWIVSHGQQLLIVRRSLIGP